MATNNPVPEKIRNYNVYKGPTATQRMIGMGAEMTLPDFAFSTEEISGAGIAGSYESPNQGHTASVAMTIPFRLIGRENLEIAEGDIADLIIRAGMQSTDTASGQIIEQGLVVNVRGPVKRINMGTVSVGAPQNAEIEIEVYYFKADQDNEGDLFTLIELDKQNFVYIVNGVDKFANLRRYI